ncbi:TPA: hypothetical protein ACG2L8_001951 [Legionella pneumophila]|nr:hypothetical protein [Legionella pneumophila]
MFYELILSRSSNLIQEFISIPHGVTSLDLTNNHLCDKSGAELAQLLA